MTRAVAGPSPATRDAPPDLALAIRDTFATGEAAGQSARWGDGLRYVVVPAREWLDHRAAAIRLGNAAGLAVPEASWAPEDMDDGEAPP